MREFTDGQLGCYAYVYDGVLDMIRDVVARRDPRRETWKSSRWIGREFVHFDDVLTVFDQPLAHERETVDRMRRLIGTEIQANPQSVRRRSQLHETEGEVDAERALRGEPDMYRRVERHLGRAAQQNVSILCRTGDHQGYTPEELFWGAAALVIAIDILEAAGYCCEVWGHFTARYTYGQSPYNGFVAFKAKSCGDPLDVDAMTAALSAWMFRAVLLTALTIRPGWDVTLGSPSRNVDMALKHLDVQQGVQVVQFDGARTQYDAVECARALIREVTRED